MSTPDAGRGASGAPSPRALRAQPGELYVRLDPGDPADLAHPVFPALVEGRRWNGWARPRFRREVAEALLTWLTDVHDPDQGWRDTGHFDGDTLVLVEAEDQYQTTVSPDRDGRYPVGAGGWCWALTVPHRSADTARHEAELLADPARFVPLPGEMLITTQSTNGTDPAFPALASVPDRRGWRVARLRREVAEAVVAWINNTTGDDLGAAYWDDDTVVVLRTEHLGEHGYLPHRITPDQHGRYPLSTGTWPWITPPAHRDPDSPHT
jgi:hypothetical protein